MEEFPSVEKIIQGLERQTQKRRSLLKIGEIHVDEKGLAKVPIQFVNKDGKLLHQVGLKLKLHPDGYYHGYIGGSQTLTLQVSLHPSENRKSAEGYIQAPEDAENFYYNKYNEPSAHGQTYLSEHPYRKQFPSLKGDVFEVDSKGNGLKGEDLTTHLSDVLKQLLMTHPTLVHDTIYHNSR